MNALAVFGNGEMNMSEALGIVVTGLVVVFLVLILLVAIFSFMGLFFKPKKKKEVKKDPVPEISVPETEDKGSVVAAITAALHQFLGGGFTIRKIRPLKVSKRGNDPWSLDGKTDNTRPF